MSSRTHTRAVVCASAARGPRCARPKVWGWRRARAARLSVIRWWASTTESQRTGSAKSRLRVVAILRWVPRPASAPPLRFAPSVVPPSGPAAPGVITPAPPVPAIGEVPAVISVVVDRPASWVSLSLPRTAPSIRGLFSTASSRAPLRVILAYSLASAVCDCPKSWAEDVRGSVRPSADSASRNAAVSPVGPVACCCACAAAVPRTVSGVRRARRTAASSASPSSDEPAWASPAPSACAVASVSASPTDGAPIMSTARKPVPTASSSDRSPPSRQRATASGRASAGVSTFTARSGPGSVSAASTVAGSWVPSLGVSRLTGSSSRSTPTLPSTGASSSGSPLPSTTSTVSE